MLIGERHLDSVGGQTEVTENYPSACLLRVLSEAAQVVDWLADMTAARPACTHMTQGVRRRGRPSGGAVVNLTALDAQTEIDELLRSWAANLVDDQPNIRPPRDRTAPAVLEFFVSNLQLLSGAEWVHLMADEIRSATTKAQKVCDSRSIYGRCSHAGCDGPLRLGDRGFLTCIAGHEYPATTWLRLAEDK